MTKEYFCWCLIPILGVFSPLSTAQENDFDKFDFYSLSVLEANPGTSLDFGMIVDIAGETVAIDIEDAKRYYIEGAAELDVFVEIGADQYLLLNGDLDNLDDPTKRIQLNLRAAFANQGQDNTQYANYFFVTNNIASAQFQIRQTGGLSAPMKPPEEDDVVDYDYAYLYIFPTLDLTGNLVSGNYSGNIILSVSYD